jgi:hypothetical protein
MLDDTGSFSIHFNQDYDVDYKYPLGGQRSLVA